MSDRLPIGWFSLIHDLRFALMRQYPTTAVRSMSADRGWLTVDIDETMLGPAERYALGRLVQGYVTQSLHTCAVCGSGHARDRGHGRVVTCDECNEET
ncbi:hypothetical protein [Agrobacterium genomosp. 2]|uniref:hypothetical protein n=1 Tax=Agrobacterium genomosp. 2 TaxID=1183409 RepID=UPI0009B93920|nr:hypothetical protein [Agrobacterium genomosp. 2]